MVKLGMRVRVVRETQKLSAACVARRLGAGPSYISRIERGSFMPSLKRFLAVAEALHVPPSALLEDEPDPLDAVIFARIRSWPVRAKSFLVSKRALDYIQTVQDLDTRGLDPDSLRALAEAAVAITDRHGLSEQRA